MTANENNLKQGAAIGGWTCFVLGAAVMYFSVWTFILYIPLFIVAFVLSIAAMAQRRIVPGLLLLLATLIVPPVQWFALSATRLEKFMRDQPPPNLSASPAHRVDSPPADVTASRAPVSGSNSSPQALIVKTLEEPLRDARASQIGIVNTRLLARNVPYQPAPVFSSDGETVTYPQQRGKSITLIVARLRDHQTLATWTPPVPPTTIAWSQDGKRLAYKTERELHIMDWSTRKDVVIPMTYEFGGNTDALAWLGPDKLASCSWTGLGYNIFTLNLDTLKVMVQASNAANWKRQMNSALAASRVHPHCEVFAKDMYIGNSRFCCLFVGEQDNSHSHVILDNFFSAQTPFYVSPDLRHILVSDGNILTHHLLGLRAAPEMRFRIDLNNQELLNTKLERAAFSDVINEGRVFYGKVYAPLKNPLNGKLVGPDRNSPAKGIVRVSNWYETHAIVANATELIPMHAGDIVADVRVEVGYFNYGDQWWPLQLLTASSDATSEAGPSKEDEPAGSKDSGRRAAVTTKKAGDENEAVEDGNDSKTQPTSSVIDSASHPTPSPEMSDCERAITGTWVVDKKDFFRNVSDVVGARNGIPEERRQSLADSIERQAGDSPVASIECKSDESLVYRVYGAADAVLAEENGTWTCASGDVQFSRLRDGTPRFDPPYIKLLVNLPDSEKVPVRMHKVGAGKNSKTRLADSAVESSNHERANDSNVEEAISRDPAADENLILAARDGDKKEVESWLRKGASVNSTTQMGETALVMAAGYGHIDAVELLIQKGANLNSPDQGGRTPLHVAAQNGHADIVKLLLAKGAKASFREKEFGANPLHLGVYNNHLDVIRVLAAKEEALDQLDVQKMTPLYNAVFRQNAEAVDILLKAGADSELKTMNLTPLHWAVFKSNRKIVRMLLDGNADANARGADGATPLDIAVEQNDKQMIQLLKQHGARRGK